MMQHILPSRASVSHTSTDPSLPPQCSMGASSDKALSFMKEHFLMDGKVSPMRGQPLLVKSDVTYTRITVHETRGVSGTTYRVMFLATGGVMGGAHRVTHLTLPLAPKPQRCPLCPTADGLLHKAVELSGGAHIVESIQLFARPEPVKNLLLAPGKVGQV